MRSLRTTSILALILLTATTAQAGVIISEVDYDQPGTDNAEWVELYNPDTAPQSLAGLELVFVNGGAGCAEYDRYDLDPITIPAGGYVVIGNHPCATPLVTLPASNAIQNGPEDSIYIEDRNTGGVVDEVEYESAASVCRALFTPETDVPDPDFSIQFCPGQGWVSGAFSPCAENLECEIIATEDASWGTLKAHF